MTNFIARLYSKTAKKPEPEAWVTEEIDEDFYKQYFMGAVGQWVAYAHKDKFMISSSTIDWRTLTIRAPDYAKLKEEIASLSPNTNYFKELKLSSDVRLWLASILFVAYQTHGAREDAPVKREQDIAPGLRRLKPSKYGIEQMEKRMMGHLQVDNPADTKMRMEQANDDDDLQFFKDGMKRALNVPAKFDVTVPVQADVLARSAVDIFVACRPFPELKRSEVSPSEQDDMALFQRIDNDIDNAFRDGALAYKEAVDGIRKRIADRIANPLPPNTEIKTPKPDYGVPSDFLGTLKDWSRK